MKSHGTTLERYPVKTKTLNEVRQEGISALTESLGPVDTIRFLQQFDLGHGDYTAERHRILGNPTVDELFRVIKERRKKATHGR
jgi:hypothetical protein